MLNGLAEYTAEHAQLLLFVLHWCAAAGVAVHVLLFKTDSRSAFGWLAVVFLLPVLGILGYWAFGINRIWHRAGEGPGPRWSDQAARLRAPPEEGKTLSPLATVGTHVTGASLIPGNRVALLINGEQAFPEMLASIRAARKEILLCTYIFDTDHSGRAFVDALACASRRGVTVCVLVDDVGRRASFPSILPALRRAGLNPRLFMPLRLFPPNLSFNLRNHRKLLIVDRRDAFAGGMNIGDRQCVTASTPRRAQDLHFRIAGPVVAPLRALFLDDWTRSLRSGRSGRSSSSGLEETALEAQPPAAATAAGTSACRVVADGPDEKLDQLALTIEGVISAARSRVLIVTPYFLPEKRLTSALQSAALRGVQVTVVIPAACNWPFVRWALNHSLYDLLNTGVRVVERRGLFAHSKCMIVDDSYALIGSHNLDARSLRLNFELGLEVFDRDFVAALMRHFDRAALAQASPVTPEQLLSRRVLTRLRDALAALFAPYL